MMTTLHRRRLLAALILWAGLLAGCVNPAQRPEPDEVVLLNDTHVTAVAHRRSPSPEDNLRANVRAILALPRRPAVVIINGDLALSVGTQADYRVLRECVTPLLDAGLKVHFNFGNHDVRSEFFAVFPEARGATSLKDGRHAAVIDLPNVRLLLLDTLKDSPAAPGILGAEQIGWILAQADASPEKPLVLVGHHNPQVGGDPRHYPGGILDTADLWPQLVGRHQVKAYLHGHTHEWTLASDNGIHVISTIASAYVFRPEINSTGWTLARFHPEGVELELRTQDPAHRWSGERKWLFWRLPPPVKPSPAKK
ncbi:MAG: metallophosphoesterase family protein [Opitutales bacterium]